MPCVLRDAPRLRQIAPQHDGMFVNRRKKIVILRCLAKRGLEGRTTFSILAPNKPVMVGKYESPAVAGF